MIYLLVDTETNGLPQDYSLSVTDLTNWPRLISVAWGLFNETGKELCRHYALVKPDGYRWNKVAQQIHGISPEQALTDGKPLAELLQQLWVDIDRADAWVGHNIDLDYNVIGSEFLRAGLADDGSRFATWDQPAWPLLCTMDASAKISPNHEPVRLDDLYQLLTGRRLKGLHNATNDMLATARCFFHLKERGYFKS